MRKSLAAFLFVLSTLAFAAPAKPPCLVSMNVPKYPPLARTARVQGTVIVKIVINEKGEVTSVTEVSGHPLLKEAAISNAKTWYFEPSAENKEIVATYKYILDEGDSDRPRPNFKVDGPASVEIYGAPSIVEPNITKTKSK